MSPRSTSTDGHRYETRDRIRSLAGFSLLSLWLAAMAWAFWLIEGRPALAPAQLASDPQRVAEIERWVHTISSQSQGLPQLVLLPQRCGCAAHTAMTVRLRDTARAQGLVVRDATPDRRSALWLPMSAGALLISPEGRLLFAGPLESPLHCSDGRSLVELILPQAYGEFPPLWGAVIDEPCACGGHYLTS